MVFSVIMIFHLDGSSDKKFDLEYVKDEPIEDYIDLGIPILLSLGDPKICPPCFALEEEIKMLKSELKDEVILKEINLSKHKEFRDIYNIEKMPTLIFYGKTIDKPESFGLEERIDSSGDKEIMYYMYQGFLEKDELKSILMELK